MKAKPKLSFWQIWNMSFGFLGIQFGFALQNANVSRIFETLGANIDNIPILWIAAPVTGLIVQPIIGHWSDNTWGRLGRRRPFFLVGAILASLALIVMPNSPMLWVAAGMLWILDASINISMEPFRAFVGDMLPSEQRTAGFAMQSFFIGIGAVVASLLPYVMTNWIGISNTAPEGEIPDSVKFSFYIGAAAFIASVVWTVFSTKEYSPEELKTFDDHKEEPELSEEENSVNTSKAVKTSSKVGIVSALIGISISILLFFIHAKQEVYILGFGLIIFGLLELFSAFLQKRGKKGGFISVLNDLNAIPFTMKQLAVVQFFSWFALFAMWIYTTNGVTADKYNMQIDKEMIQFLETEIVADAEISDERKNELTKELNIYKTKIDNSEKAAIKVNTVKYFLSGRLFNETELAENIEKALAGYTGKDKETASELAEELKDFRNKKNPDLNFETVDFAYKALAAQRLNLPNIDTKRFEKYVRLKEIRKEFNDGADWVGVGFGVYNGFAAVFAFLLVFLAKLTNRKITHMIALVVGGLSYLFIFYTNDTRWILLLPFVGIGLAWASILAMPYAILTGSLPQNKMGVYMGIFNFFIVIPQILAASILGYLVQSLFKGEAIYAMVLGGVSLLIAAATVLFVKDED
jgi:maltose/moltooligosaccharide transporter